jgi:hypothetical protein
VSLDTPTVAVVFGSVAPFQGDVVSLRVHLGCTREVSSFEVLLQNWDSKYSPNGTYPITVGLDGSISVGRGVTCPLLLTCRVESVKYESTPLENYLRVSGRCWGERLFRSVVSKTYLNMKGEDIISDFIEYHVGLSHVRNSNELVEDTDTTYTKLEFSDTPVFDVIRQIAQTSDKSGVIGYDFRVAPDGKFEFFAQNSKTSTVSLNEKIECSEFSREISAVRNKITVYGAAEQSVPSDKDSWTESTSSSDGTWTAISGVLSLDSTVKVRGSASIKTYAQNLYGAGCIFTFNLGKSVNTEIYPTLNLWLNQDDTFNGNITITLYDTTDKTAQHEITMGSKKWFQTQIGIGSANADLWQMTSGFDWTQVWRVRVDCWFATTGTGSFWVDGLFFGGCRFSSVQQDTASQASFGVRELVEVNEELYSNAECESHAKALLSNNKDPADSLTVQSSVLDFGSSPILAGDKVFVELPNEDVSGYFRVLSAEYLVDGKTQTLTVCLELGREKPLLADYVYALKSKTESLSRYKTSKRGG